MGSKKIVISRYQHYSFEERTIKASKELVDKYVQIFYENNFCKIDITEVVAKIIGRRVCKNKRYPNTIHTRDFASRTFTEFLMADVKRREIKVDSAVYKYLLVNNL